MRISELIENFGIFTTNEEGKLLKKLDNPIHLNSFSDREQVVIENMVRKGLVIKIGQSNPIIIANEL